jgi:Rho family, other
LENVGSKWVAEITEHCQGVKVVLVALKCDLREEHEKDDDGNNDGTGAAHKPIIQYQEGLEVARRIGALRYLGMLDEMVGYGRLGIANLRNVECSAMRNRGVNEAFTEAARVALQVKPTKSKASNRDRCSVM